jgi:hypothetical protein
MPPGFTLSCLGGLCSLVWAGFPVGPEGFYAVLGQLARWFYQFGSGAHCNNYFYYYFKNHMPDTSRTVRDLLSVSKEKCSRAQRPLCVPKRLVQQQVLVDRSTALCDSIRYLRAESPPRVSRLNIPTRTPAKPGAHACHRAQ